MPIKITMQNLRLIIFMIDQSPSMCQTGKYDTSLDEIAAKFVNDSISWLDNECRGQKIFIICIFYICLNVKNRLEGWIDELCPADKNITEEDSNTYKNIEPYFNTFRPTDMTETFRTGKPSYLCNRL